MSYIHGGVTSRSKKANADGGFKYRLYSDGTVINQGSGNVVGFIAGPELRVILDTKSAKERQKAIIDYLNLNEV